AEARDRDSQRPGLVEHMPDGAVLARRIGTLQDDEQRPFAFPEQFVLPGVDALAVLLALRLSFLPVRKSRRVAWIDLGELYPLAGRDAKLCCKDFCHGVPLVVASGHHRRSLRDPEGDR